MVSGIEISSDPAGAEQSARAQNPDSTSLVGIELASHKPRNQASRKSIRLQPIRAAALVSAKGFVNDW
jgi:hypothetical protein